MEILKVLKTKDNLKSGKLHFNSPGLFFNGNECVIVWDEFMMSIETTDALSTFVNSPQTSQSPFYRFEYGPLSPPQSPPAVVVPPSSSPPPLFSAASSASWHCFSHFCLLSSSLCLHSSSFSPRLLLKLPRSLPFSLERWSQTKEKQWCTGSDICADYEIRLWTNLISKLIWNSKSVVVRQLHARQPCVHFIYISHVSCTYNSWSWNS